MDIQGLPEALTLVPDMLPDAYRDARRRLVRRHLSHSSDAVVEKLEQQLFEHLESRPEVTLDRERIRGSLPAAPGEACCVLLTAVAAARVLDERLPRPA